jgi:hypothetical protein
VALPNQETGASKQKEFSNPQLAPDDLHRPRRIRWQTPPPADVLYGFAGADQLTRRRLIADDLKGAFNFGMEERMISSERQAIIGALPRQDRRQRL